MVDDGDLIVDDRPVPAVPLWLGLAGAVPFVGLSALIVLPHFDINLGLAERFLHHALLTYAALIASFLGGVRWGVAFTAPSYRQSSLFVVSILPSLVAWLALALPRPYDLVLVLTLFLCMLVIDIWLVRERLMPRWFGSLRLLLSALVVLSLLGPLALELGL
jgi:Protein of unknown function (DUF3429)